MASWRAATYVDKILKGAKPGDLPVELPTRFKLVVNMKATKTIGLTVPQVILLCAEMALGEKFPSHVDSSRPASARTDSLRRS